MLRPVLKLLTKTGELCAKHRSVHGAEPVTTENSREFYVFLTFVMLFKMAILCVP